MITLKYWNDWEVDNYSVEGGDITSLTEVEINRERFDVTNSLVEVPYSDMGHASYATSTHYFITTKVFGIPMEFDLNTLVNKVKIIPIKYTVTYPTKD